ncbi:DMT family transporter [Hoeflea alexandrii]|uniref:DMT family transporter n=1 Tax=Hoeflea alexandrii TaxID=288436 RepID=UPI002271FCDD|nr:DMT family transporter [Hoeflea alexandrii]MCY0154046.1 DMT family transporter [Hoeflea alexandrii]
MTTHIATDLKANLVGSGWMIASMAVFAVEDAFIKAASVTLPVGQVLVIFGLGGALVFASLALYNREPLYSADVISRPMWIRVVFEIIGRLFYVLALSLIPLSAATVILQAAPLVVVAGAALVFGEKVGWRRWSAIFVGLAGVVIIIQPGTDSFSALSLLAVAGMIGFAGRDLASRAAPGQAEHSDPRAVRIPPHHGCRHGFYAAWQGVPFVMPDGVTSFYVLGAVLSGVIAYSCLMKAMRTGEVSAVTPFRYSRLLFGIALGIILFDEQLSLAMMVGSGLIVASGLFILLRGRQVRGTK